MAILEIAIVVADQGPGRAQAGDIAVAREPTGIIGNREGANRLWMQIDTVLTREDLKDYEAPRNAEGRPDLGTTRGRGRRRYNIDLPSLVATHGLSASRIKDEGDVYQPLIGITISGTELLDKRSGAQKTAIDAWRANW